MSVEDTRRLSLAGREGLEWTWKVGAISTVEWLGAVSAVAGMVVGAPTYFWVWVGLVFFVIAVFVWHGWREKNRSKFMIGCLGTVFMFIILVRDAPLGIVPRTNIANYADGTKIGSITWQARMSELRISFKNDTDDDYTQLDARVWIIDRYAEEIRELSNLGCTIRQERPAFVIDAQYFERSGSGKITQKATTYGGAVNLPYHFECNRLPGHSEAEFLAPIDNIDGDDSRDPLKARRQGRKLIAQKVLIRADYRGLFGRPHVREIWMAPSGAPKPSWSDADTLEKLKP